MSGRALQYGLALGCAGWVMVFAAWQGDFGMLLFGAGMVLVTVLTIKVDVRRSQRGDYDRWKE